MRRLMPLLAAGAMVLSTAPAYADLGDQLFKLLAKDGAEFDVFGFSVAINGATAIVGAFGDDDNGDGSGSAYLFDITTGLQIAKLLANDGARQDWFGISVSISGETAIVGARNDDDNGSSSGSAYLFDTITGWQVAKLLANDGASEDSFGVSVAINGATAIVGALGHDDTGIDSGSAYLFDTTTGHQIAKLLANDGAPRDWFGNSVSISGEIAIVGAYHDDDNGTDSGSAYLFDISDPTNPTQLFKLLPDDGAADDEFGRSVAISGATAIVGAHRDDDNTGSAYLFDTTTGRQIAKLLANDGKPCNYFGASVAISGDTAIVGAATHRDNGVGSGSAYLFDTTTGQQVAELLANDGVMYDSFGRSVAISGDTAIVGASGDDDNGTSSGSAYLFDAGRAPGPGNLNCDDEFDKADIDPFFLALSDPAAYLAAFPDCNINNADMNCDQALNGADIDRFFAWLAGNIFPDCNANGIPDDCDGIGPLALVTQPQSTLACVGDTFVALSVGTSRFPLTVQWRKNGSPIAGATSMRLWFNPVQFDDAGDYDVIVGDACVSLTSDIATLTVHPPPSINTHPQSQVVCLGEPLVLSVDTTGPALTYQWRKDRRDIPGATDPTYIVPAASRSDRGVYDVAVANRCDTVRSDPASVTIQSTIHTHPVGQTVCENDPVFFTVGASGQSLTYQWRKDGVGISGATLNFFVINAAALSDAGIYDVVVTSTACTQTSDPAPLVVQQCP